MHRAYACNGCWCQAGYLASTRLGTLRSVEAVRASLSGSDQAGLALIGRVGGASSCETQLLRGLVTFERRHPTVLQQARALVDEARNGTSHVRNASMGHARVGDRPTRLFEPPRKGWWQMWGSAPVSLLPVPRPSFLSASYMRMEREARL